MTRAPVMRTICILLLTGACAGDAPDPVPRAAGAAQEPPQAADPVSRREPTALTERDVTAYLDAVAALARAGERVRAETLADTLGVVENEGVLAASPAARNAIRGAGFEQLEQFHQVAYNIAAALQAPSAEALADMPVPDDPEERAALAEVRAAMAEFATAQPPGNIEVVSRFRERILAAQSAP